MKDRTTSLSQNKTPAVWSPFSRSLTDEKAYDLEHTHTLYKDVRAQHLGLPDNLAAQIVNPIVDRLLAELPFTEDSPVPATIDTCLHAILAHETVIFEMPDFPTHLSLREKVELRRFLHAKQYFITNQDKCITLLIDTIHELFVSVAQHVPANSPKTAFTVPLIYLLPEAATIVHNVIVTLMSDELLHAGLFVDIRDTIYQNLCTVSKIPLDSKPTKPFVMPTDCKLQPLEMMQAYLGGTPFVELFSLPLPFALEQETRFSGQWIVAPQGRGKTTVMLSMLKEDLERDASIIIMDSKGDLIGPIRSLKSLENRLCIVEPDPDYPLALNPLDIPRSNLTRTIGLLEYVFSALLEAKLTALQKTLFRNLLPALVECVPNPTLATFRDMVENGVGAYHRYFEHLSPLIKGFLDNQFNQSTYEDTRRQLVWRLDYLMTNPLLNAIFNSPRTKFDIGKEMDAGKVILINNSTELLEEHGAEFMGRFFIALVLSAAQQRSGRPRSEKLPCYFYIDEAHRIISRDERITTTLDEVRSQNVALILAHQRCDQIRDKDVMSALQNCAIRMANSDEDAKFLADNFRTTPEFLRSLNPGQFAVWTRELRNDPALPLTVPYHNLDKEPQLTSDERIQLRERTRREFCNPAAIIPQRPKQEQPKPSKPQPKRRAGSTDEWHKHKK